MKMQSRGKYVAVLVVVSVLLSVLVLSVGCKESDTDTSGEVSNQTSDETSEHGASDASQIGKTGRPQVIAFSQQGCPACPAADEMVEQIGKERAGEIDVFVVDVGEELELARQFGIQATPTVVVLDSNGEIVDGFVGAPEKSQLEAVIDRAL